MKKFIISLIAAFSFVVAASAQDTFQPGFVFGFGAGVNATPSADAPFTSTLAFPTADIWAGYEFCAPLGIRAGITYAGARTAYDSCNWDFKHLMYHADLVLDIANCFSFNEGRAVNPFLFAGFAFDRRFDNGISAEQALAYNAPHGCEDNCRWWDGAVNSYAARLGAGFNFRLSDKTMLSMELTDNIMTDRFNSLYDNGLHTDNHLSLTVGMKFTFDQARKYRNARFSNGPAPDQNAGLAAAQEAERRALEAKEAAEKAAAEALAAKEAAEKAAAAREQVQSGIAIAVSNPLFKIGSSELSDIAKRNLKALADALLQQPGVNITVTGYADKQTGTAELNWTLSRKRAEAVLDFLTFNGVPASQIKADWKGDTEAVADTAEANRTVVISIAD